VVNASVEQTGCLRCCYVGGQEYFNWSFAGGRAEALNARGRGHDVPKSTNRNHPDRFWPVIRNTDTV